MKKSWTSRFGATSVAICLGLAMAGCSSGGGDDVDAGGSGDGGLPALTQNQIYAPDGTLSARIQTTTGGVPHITADNLESAAYGAGYVQARDNLCLIADSILRARGERAAFYGPGPDLAPGVPIGVNVVTDFSYKALGLLEKANENYDQLSAPSQSMLRGFAEGYNQYVDETPEAERPSKCANQDWVRAISPQDLYAYYQLVALYASGDNFTGGPIFLAVPPGDPSAVIPRPAMDSNSADTTQDQAQRIARAIRGLTPQALDMRTDYNDRGMASNGWGIGGEMTENGRGALLANPHFPYTGNRRLYQSHITVPGVYDVNGASLIGFVIPLIGFNEDIAWTHTVSTAQHFTLYDLALASGDNETYIKDGAPRPITSRTLTIDVATGAGTTVPYEREFYFSEHGPMLAANLINGALPAWGETFAGRSTAFTYRDANADTARRVIDQWLAMGRASTLEQFQQPFASCGSVLWVNTMYADASGRAFYIDGTAVPDLSQGALTAFGARANANPVVGALAQNNVTLLDGSRGLNDWVEGECDGRVPYAGMPKLERRDYVQNSNDSYWATNPDAFLTGFSPLFGSVETPLSPRTRMGLEMLENPTDPGLSDVAPAGSDGRFSGEEIINALYSNRAYYAETLLDELLARCNNAGSTAIATGSGDRPVADGCTALANWDGVYDIDSRGAHVFRVFIADYTQRLSTEFTVPFDPSNPGATPSTPRPAPENVSQDPMLAALARGLNRLDQVGIAYDAPLGDVQRAQQSTGTSPFGPAPGAPQGLLAWHGNQNVEGGFNIVRPASDAYEDGTRFPRYAPATLQTTGDLSSNTGEGWLIAYGTSWHFGLDFTDDGPRGYGLISYGQSDDPSSEHYADQDQLYSNKQYRRLLYRQADITADENLETETIETTVAPGGDA